MNTREYHRQAVAAFLHQYISKKQFHFSLPHGWGGETYFAHNTEETVFVKLGAPTSVYEAVAMLGFTPPVLASGVLDDGTTILVQPFIEGTTPTRRDYRLHLEQFAQTINTIHHSEALKQVLPPAAAESFRSAGMAALHGIETRWQRYRMHVPEVAGFIDESLASLGQRIEGFEGGGLAASHNDICNANWLLTPEEKLYLIDLDAMALDDPAVDIGATLWWYYPPILRQRFLSITGYAGDSAFALRMQVRMAMHCLHISIPRPNSFDIFNPASFVDSMADFQAALAGEENPQGYE